MQVPTETNDTLVPAIVQTPGVADEKLTANPDEAVADIVTGLSSNRLSANAPKLTVWSPLATANDCCT